MRIRVLAPLLTACALAATPLLADEVLLKNGSRVIGEVVHLVEGKLKVKTVFAKELEIDWSEVASVTTDKPLPFIMKGGNVLQGQAIPGAEGQLNIKTQLAAPVPIPLADIAAINPPLKPAMTFKGFAALGATVTDGNTQTKSLYGNAEFEARSESQRFTLRGATNYAEDRGRLTARNSRGSMKYDYFFTKRFYAYAAALFEGDKFQDLKLRTALSAGPGYQFIDIGDFTEPWLHDLQVSGEVGLAYFAEDFGSSPDQQYVAARWAAKVLWPILPKKVVMFHNQEGYPGLERAKDIYITTEQGVRFTILENFFAAIQVNWRWDNTPADGKERSDTAYLFSLGYNFDFAR